MLLHNRALFDDAQMMLLVFVRNSIEVRIERPTSAAQIMAIEIEMVVLPPKIALTKCCSFSFRFINVSIIL